MNRDTEQKFLHFLEDKSAKEIREEYSGEYSCWTNTRRRCRENDYQFSIAFSEFRDFLAYLGPRPSPEHSLDRIDYEDTEYAPGKVRWATKREQANNRSNTVFLKYDGTKLPKKFHGLELPLTEWAEELDVSPSTLRRRRSDGWTENEILEGQRSLEVKPFHKMSKSELLNYQPWDEGRERKDEMLYHKHKEKGESRYEFIIRFLIADWRADLMRQGRKIAHYLPDLEAREPGLASEEVQAYPDHVNGKWLMHDETDPAVFSDFCAEVEEYATYQRSIRAEYKEWKAAVKTKLLPEQKSKSAKEMESRYRQEFSRSKSKHRDKENFDDWDE